ncbi:hypothetical protein JY96_00280 [Aquabacterium sp. NJ1]|uniref:hypothetical protein n=1 Tax=Aquabacterium sp. NJ1 TaxID=1538295 RepID=UPI00052C2CAE|nr:hypothetical protein [Aquabacterium sp. NJ1]KGM38971.1 hypothetical protein JY96_00280 [Aquabacterium sp. NJ1]
MMNTTALPLNTAEALNLGCYCRTLSTDKLQGQLEKDASLAGMAQDIARTRPHLFSSTVVFLSQPVVEQMRLAVQALERVMAQPAYQSQALARAPAIARHDFGPLGMFMGYDFHLGALGPRLIEVNTNAGGAMLNAALSRAQQSCCEVMNWAFQPDPTLVGLEDAFFEMFTSEWRSQRGDAPMGLVIIVDDDPAAQYLAPEFELCRQMLKQRGLDARIVAPEALEWRDGQLRVDGSVVGMVYNRLTDFYLAEPAHGALKSAYEAGAVVMSPHPRAHALHAEKRNLVALSDTALLAAWGVSEADRALLAAVVPPTVQVTPERAEELWAQRRQWFFKPESGYGGKAVYRGDKLTRRVWQDITSGGFVAQAMVPPSGRLIEVDGVQTDLKFDIRAYAYAGQVQLLAARMYTGQTTNFRTPGGGFAPVVIVP